MNRHLFDTMLSGRERYAESVIEHTMLGINRILNVSSAIPEESGPQQPMPGIPALVERPAPSSPATPTAGTAGVGVFYPVTCDPRFYDAASKILEDDLHLYSHDNCNELGALIQQWINDARDNWEPR